MILLWNPASSYSHSRKPYGVGRQNGGNKVNVTAYEKTITANFRALLALLKII